MTTTSARRASLPPLPGGLSEATKAAIQRTTKPLAFYDFLWVVLAFGGLPPQLSDRLLSLYHSFSGEPEDDPVAQFLMGVSAVFAAPRQFPAVARLLSSIPQLLVPQSPSDLLNAGSYLIQTAIRNEQDPFFRREMLVVDGCVRVYNGSRKMSHAVIQGEVLDRRLGPAPPRILVRRMLTDARYRGLLYGLDREVEFLEKSYALIDASKDSLAAAKYFAELGHCEVLRRNFDAASTHFDRSAECRKAAATAGIPEWVDIMASRMAIERSYAISKAAGDWSAPVRRYRPESLKIQS